MLYRSILLPVDIANPELAPAIFETAKALLAPGGKMMAVYVVPDIPAYVTAEMPETFVTDTIRTSEQTLRDLVATAGIDATVKILTGQAPRAVLDTAQQEGADLIVVASHRPGLADYLLGSTAARIVRHAQCAVMVLR